MSEVLGINDRERIYRIGPIRPPSEASSLLLQITNGCTWNKCKFCQLYRHTKFRAFSADSIKADIDTIAFYAEKVNRYRRPDGSYDLEGVNAELGSPEYTDEERQCLYNTAVWLVNGGENVFLQDGNSTALSSGRLTDVLIYLRQVFPQIKRVTSYGRAENLSRTSAEGYAELKAAGLDRIHSGFETGSDEVLRKINKGVTSEQEITAGQNIKAGGIELSIYFMPGVGGMELTRENAEGTARVLNAVNPDFFRVRTCAVKPGTGLYEDWQNGDFTLCGEEDKLREIRRVIELADGVSTRIVSDHILNLIQTIEGPIVADRARLLGIIDDYFDMPLEDRRLYQVARRIGRVNSPDDLLSLSPEYIGQLRGYARNIADNYDWEERMNEIIVNYI